MTSDDTKNTDDDKANNLTPPVPIEEDYGAQTKLLTDEEKQSLFEEDNVDEGFWWHNPIQTFEPPQIPDQFANLELQREFEQKIESKQFTLLDIPSNINEIVKITSDPNFDYEEIARLVSQSPVLTADYLKLANSAIYNRGKQINDIRVILPRLGVTIVKSVLYLNSAKINLANQPLFKNVATSVVEHSRIVAIIAKYLSQRYYPDPDNAYMAGLLHDIGKLAILKELTTSNQKMLDSNEEYSKESFSTLFSLFHEIVGGLIAKSWNLDNEIYLSIAYHHRFSELDYNDDNELGLHLAALINFSDIMAQLIDKNYDFEGISIFNTPAAEILNIERDDSTIEFFNHVPEIIESN